MEKLVKRASHFIAQKQQYDEEKEAVIAYGMLALIQMIIILLFALIWGFLTDTLIECIVIYFAVGILRKFTGGAHANTMIGCIFVSITTMSIMGILSHYFISPRITPIVMLIATVFCYLLFYTIIWYKAPVDSPNKPIKQPEKIKRLRKQSLCYLTFCFFISILIDIRSFILPTLAFYYINCSLVLALGWQCITLTKKAGLLFHNNRIN